MAWYDKYLSIYGKPLNEVPLDIVIEIKNQLVSLQK